MDSSTPQRFRLLDLPPEITNEIFYYAVVSSTPVPIRREKPYVNEPAILSTCKSIRHEALPMFYSANTFQPHETNFFKGVDMIAVFFNSLSDGKLSLLRRAHLPDCSHVLSVESETWVPLIRKQVAGLIAQMGRKIVGRDVVRIPLVADEQSVEIAVDELGEIVVLPNLKLSRSQKKIV